MHVSASRYADLFARIGASPQQDARGAVTAQQQQSTLSPSREKTAEPEDRPAYFSMISTISPGSLAAAYQVMRAREDGGAPAASGPAQGRAILSGLGIPSALDADGEVLESD